MGIQIEKRLILVEQRSNQKAQDPVLENVGMMAGMEGVTVTEHVMVPKKDCGISGRYAATGNAGLHPTMSDSIAQI
jgi:hypothetical protein